MDDGEQPMDRFDVENDFEGGEWIGGEFFHRGKRQRQSQTKEQAIYGSFMEDSGQWRCARWEGQRSAGPGRAARQVAHRRSMQSLGSAWGAPQRLLRAGPPAPAVPAACHYTLWARPRNS